MSLSAVQGASSIPTLLVYRLTKRHLGASTIFSAQPPPAFKRHRPVDKHGALALLIHSAVIYKFHQAGIQPTILLRLLQPYTGPLPSRCIFFLPGQTTMCTPKLRSPTPKLPHENAMILPDKQGKWQMANAPIITAQPRLVLFDPHHLRTRALP